VDNTSSGTLVIVDPLSDIDESVLQSHVVLSVFLLYVLKKRKCYHFYLNATSRESQKLIPGRKKSLFQSQKLVHGKHKKSLIRKIKLPPKFRATRYSAGDVNFAFAPRTTGNKATLGHLGNEKKRNVQNLAHDRRGDLDPRLSFPASYRVTTKQKREF